MGRRWDGACAEVHLAQLLVRWISTRHAARGFVHRAILALGRLWRPAGYALCALGLASSAVAEEWRVIGSRFQGMGGAGVAVADGAAAAYWNPGALAFVPALVEIELPIGVSAATEGDLLKNASQLVDFLDRTGFDDTFDKIEGGEPLSERELGDTVRLVTTEVPAFARSGQGALVTADAGFSLRFGSWVLTARGTGLLGLDPVLDTSGLGFGSDVVVRVQDLVGAGADRSADFASSASQSLADSIVGLSGLTQEQAEELVFQAERAGVDTTDPTVRSLVSQVTASGVSDRLNETGAVVRGLYTKEVGIAHGIRLSENLGFGAHFRHVHATTIDKMIRLEDDDRSIGTENRRRSTNLAVDLGLLYAYRDWIRLGLAARNVNRPEFKTRGSHPFELKPQVRLGASMELSPTWRIAADLDVTENDYETIDGFESRQLAIGMEYRSRFVGHSVDLRAGIHRNLASGPNDDIAVTLGFGFYAGNFLFDLSLGSALERRRFEELERHLPRRIDVATTLRWITEF